MKARTPLLERFWRNVDQRAEGCWPWLGTIGQKGYGQIFDTPSRKTIAAHRISYEIHKGPIPTGETVDHTCHNADAMCMGGPCPHRRCVNPAHLEAVPRGVNVLRGKTITARFAAVTHCPDGHEYTDENTFRESKGRQCRECGRQRARIRMAALYARRRNAGECLICGGPTEDHTLCEIHLHKDRLRGRARREAARVG